MAPAVALAPEDQLSAIIDDLERLAFDVDVHPLLDHRLDLAIGGIRHADIEALLISADSLEPDVFAQVARERLDLEHVLETAERIR